MVRRETCAAEYVMEICGQRISLRFLEAAPEPELLLSVRHLLRDGADPPGGGDGSDAVHTNPAPGADEVFWCIRKGSRELAAFLPEEYAAAGGRYVMDTAEGRLAFSAEFGFLSLYAAACRETFLWICPDKHAAAEFIAHPFRMELGWWALRNGMTFLHGGAVGVSGQGVLLAGAGGSGKSTLAMSALSIGMDFLADDYLLVRQGAAHHPATEACSGEPGGEKPGARGVRALRIYGTGYLMGDVLGRLPEYREKILWKCADRDKYLIAPEGPGEVVDELTLRAVVIPHIVHGEKPVITRNPDIRKLIPMLATTSYQGRELRNREMFFRMMRLLRDLPAYDFYLTDDIPENARFLREWIRSDGGDYDIIGDRPAL